MRSALARRVLLSHLVLRASPSLSFRAPPPSAGAGHPRFSRSRGTTPSTLLGRGGLRRPHLPASAHNMSTASSDADAATKRTFAPGTLLGGDFAGLSATFSPTTGALVPVPEHLVPESMVEWGDIPSSLETLASEGWTDEEAGEGGEMERTIVTVLPEVGCGIDNLEVTKKTETFGSDASRMRSWPTPRPDRDVVAVDRRGPRRLDTETIFQIDPTSDEEGDASPRRLCVSLSVDLPEGEGDPVVSKLVALLVERRSSPTSSRGEAWSGPQSNSGGLDARTVMNTIGKDIVYGDAFAVKRVKGGGDVWDLSLGDEGGEHPLELLEGRWTVGDGEVPRTKDDFAAGDADSLATIRLPQNILVRYGRGASDETEGWAVEVSRIDAVVEDGEETSLLQRRVVVRSLGSVVDGGEGDIDFRLEERPLASS